MDENYLDVRIGAGKNTHTHTSEFLSKRRINEILKKYIYIIKFTTFWKEKKIVTSFTQKKKKERKRKEKRKKNKQEKTPN